MRFVNPDGESLDSIAPDHTKPLGDWTRLVAIHREQRIHIDKKTAVRRAGDRMDYGYTVDGLMQRAARARGVSAGTRVR